MCCICFVDFDQNNLLHNQCKTIQKDDDDSDGDSHMSDTQNDEEEKSEKKTELSSGKVEVDQIKDDTVVHLLK